MVLLFFFSRSLLCFHNFNRSRENDISVFLHFRLALAGCASLALLAGFGPDAPAPAAAQTPCADWNTESFFESATAADVSRCVAAGADVGARDDDDRTPLHLAAANSESLPVVRALLEAGADPEARDKNGLDAAHWAMTNDRLPFEAVGLLSAHEFPYAKDADDTSP